MVAKRTFRWRPRHYRVADARKDAVAGVVLGVESVPDGLASGLLAGVNPVSGLYGYLYGMIGGATLTGTPFMAVQATGAMALVVADAGLASMPDPERALFTLSVLTGIVMAAAGLAGAGRLLRFVPSSVMVGFITAVGVNIVLGQLGNFTGYDAPGPNRIARTVELVTHPWEIELATLAVGVATLVLIVLLSRTRLGAAGMLIAIVVGSSAAVLLDGAGGEISTVADLAVIPASLPSFTWPAMADASMLIVPALSLAFVGLIQGAGVSSAFPPESGGPPDPKRDFVGQGAGNVLSGLFQGMPVGGSMSASALVSSAGARTRGALFVAGGVMAIVTVAFADVVSRVAMPALAALLITIGIGAIKPAQVRSVVKTGNVQSTTMAITFVLTLLIPLQYAVLTGVALAIVMYVFQESNHLVLKRLTHDESEGWSEGTMPPTVDPHDVVVIQAYGSLFFASAPVLESLLPDPSTAERSVVILRLRGVDTLGLSIIDVLDRYCQGLQARGSKLLLVVNSERALGQIRSEGLLDRVGESNVYRGTDLLGNATRQAYAEAIDWTSVEVP